MTSLPKIAIDSLGVQGGIRVRGWGVELGTHPVIGERQICSPRSFRSLHAGKRMIGNMETQFVVPKLEGEFLSDVWCTLPPLSCR